MTNFPPGQGVSSESVVFRSPFKKRSHTPTSQLPLSPSTGLWVVPSAPIRISPNLSFPLGLPRAHQISTSSRKPIAFLLTFSEVSTSLVSICVHMCPHGFMRFHMFPNTHPHFDRTCAHMSLRNVERVLRVLLVPVFSQVVIGTKAPFF